MKVAGAQPVRPRAAGAVGGTLRALRRSPALGRALELAGLLLGWRVALLLFAVIAVQLGPGVAPPESATDLLRRIVARWDAGWYLSIAEGGYTTGRGQPANVAFNPLLPGLIYVVHSVVPSYRAAGVVVVHLALFGALAYLYALARLDYDRATATRAAAFLLLCPAAVFLGAIYTESLLLLTMTASVYHARRGQWWLAGLWGAAAGLAKIVGVLVLVPLLWEYWRGGLWHDRRQFLRTLPALALAPLGMLLFLAYLHLRFGSYRVYFAAQEGWNRYSFFRPFFPDGWDFLTRFLRGEETSRVNYFYPQGMTFPSPSAFMAIDLLFLLVFLAVGLALCLKVRGSYGLFVLAVLGVAAFSGSPQSLNRFATILFPAFIGFALVARRPLPGFGLLVLCGLLQAFFTFLFVNGFWAG